MNSFIYSTHRRGFSTRSLNLLQAGTFVNKCRHRRAFKNLFRSFVLLIQILVLCPLPSAAARAESSAPPPGLSRLIRHGAVGMTKNGKMRLAVNLDQPLVPASILKLVTALAALTELGPGYRFRTEIYLDDADNLYLKGYGDPYLVSEEIGPLLQRLKEKGISTIKSIYLDESAFALEESADGLGASLNPYDVGPAALVVNFNTVNLAVAADGRVDSAEPQTPLLPLMTRLGRKLPPGEHRLNVSTDRANPVLLTGQLLRAFQRRAGIPGDGDYARKTVPNGARLVLVHRSGRNLAELIEGLMRYSNNFTANQIYLVLGAEKYGYPANWAKSRRALSGFLDREPSLNGKIVMVEGSGLSRRNRVTARAMLRVLELFRPFADLLPAKDDLLLKSGTLTGVYSYAGYRPGPAGLERLVIILNQSDNNRDKIVKFLERHF